MVGIDEIKDAEQLRQVAQLLDRENAKLHEKVRELARRIAELEGRDLAGSQLELAYLKELLAARERALFGAKSEKRAAPTAEPVAADASAEQPPRRGHGPRQQAELPVVERPHELPEGERSCPACGGELTEMAGQSEDSEEITVVERRFHVVKHRRLKYRCACNGHVATAPAPERVSLFDDGRAGRYSLEFAIEVAIDKYLDHLPLERQVRKMEREGLTIDSQTLWNQLEALGRRLAPAHEALRDRILLQPVVGADETWWRLMQGKGSKRWWAWSVTSTDAVFYRILDSRSQAAARELLGDYRGIVLADGYGAYQALAKGGAGFALAHCWAHVRRKLLEAEAHFPEPCRELLDTIGALYQVEREAGDQLELRARLRSQRSRTLVAELRARAFELRQATLPKSSLGEALGYLLGLWDGLVRFLDEPRIPLDNNATERALRGAVVGRKNHYGSRSQRGTEVAALFYSLIESAKLCRVEPKDYLQKAAVAAIRDRTVLLPHELAA
jgi:transposase